MGRRARLLFWLISSPAACTRPRPPARPANPPLSTPEIHRLPAACNSFSSARSTDLHVELPSVAQSSQNSTPWYTDERFTGLAKTTRPARRVAVGIIDSAVRATDPRFGGRVVNRLECPGGDVRRCANGLDDDGNGRVDDIMGWNFLTHSSQVDAERFPGSSGGHGTRVASAIAAIREQGTWGANPWVDVVPAVISEREDDGGRRIVASTDNIIAAMCYLLGLRQRGLDLVAINVSMGFCGSITSAEDLRMISEVVNALNDEGVLLVAATTNMGMSCQRGDGSQDCDNLDVCPWYPASLPLRNVLAVTGASRSAGICSGGSRLRCSGYGQSVHLMAPAGGIPTLGFEGTTDLASGTSLAAPIVTGIAALVAASLPTRPAATELRARLVRTVTSAANSDDTRRTCSGGMVNAPRAIAGVGDAGANCFHGP